MKTKSIVSIISMLLIIGTAVTVSGATINSIRTDRDIPDPNQSSVTLTGANGLFTCPRGDGATYQYVVVTVRNAMGQPMANIPASNVIISITPQAGTIYYGTFSIIVTPVDAVTNANGQIRFTLKAATSIVGYVDIRATVLGIQFNAISLQCNSVDMNADGAINLSDISLFTQFYFGVYNFRADFTWDGAINLSDISIFTQHYFHS